MTITVTDFSKSLHTRDRFDHIIGLLDPVMKQEWGQKLSEVNNRTMFWCDDTLSGHNAPSRKMVENIIDTFKTLKLVDHEKKVLIHCFAGIARSTATGIGLLIMRHPDWTMEQVFNQMEIIRPIMYPNDRILEHFDDLLSLNGRLIEQHQRFKKATALKDGKLWMPPN